MKIIKNEEVALATISGRLATFRATGDSQSLYNYSVRVLNAGDKLDPQGKHPFRPAVESSVYASGCVPTA